MILSDAAIKNRTTVFVGMLMIIIAGVMSYQTLPRESSPEVKVPYIIITTTQSGELPADIETKITKEIETKLTGIKGLKEIKSTSSLGMSQIIVEFEAGTDIDKALQRVKDKVDLAKSKLPKNADEPVEPVVDEINLAEKPIMLITMSGDISQVRMKTYAEDLEEKLEKISGVLEVEIIGALERVIRVEVDPYKVCAYEIPLLKLTQFVKAEHINTSAGGIEGSVFKTAVRIPGEITNPAEIDRFPISVFNSQPIYLSDVGAVRDGFKDRSTISRTNFKPSITIQVKKRVGANIVDIAKAVKAEVKIFQENAPKGLTYSVIDDRSKDINNMVLDLENNIFTGLVLVIGVLFLFMGLRTSLIVATAIPLSMLMSFAVLSAIGITLNMVVLFALILALGMLVDNAIVIVENVYRYMEMGYDRVQAAKRGTSEVAWPVIASTATTVAAFFPLLFWPGTMGDFMQYIPLTLIVVLVSSLVVAMMISPVICSVFGKPGKKKPVHKKEHWFVTGYRKLQRLALSNPLTTLTMCASILVIVVIIYARKGNGVELFPDIDPNQATINILAPQGTHINESDRLARIVEERIRPLQYGPDGTLRFTFVSTNVGGGGQNSFEGGGSVGTHNTDIQIIFCDYEDRIDKSGKPWRSADIIKEMRELIKDIPGAEFKAQKQKEGPPTGSAITVRISGDDLKQLKILNEKTKNIIESINGVVNMRSDMEAEKPELNFITDREQAAKLGLDTATISQYIKTCLYGSKVGEFRDQNDTYDIRLRAPLDFRSKIENLQNLKVPSKTGKAVPITSTGKFHYKPGLGTIYRVDNKRAVTITADVVEGINAAEVREKVQAAIAEKLNLPAGYSVTYAGEQEDMDETKAFLSKAFVIALLLIIAILVTQFNTLMVPFIIMITILLSLIGVFMGLLFFNMPFGMVMTGVGVISLAGVVVNNAIVLLDYTRQLQLQGKNVIDAAVEAGVTRLRPVMLTAITTILGLIPMVTGISFDFHKMEFAMRSSTSQWWQSMASAVIFGLGFATLLTLLVVPAMYVMMYRIARKLGLGKLEKVGESTPEQEHILEDY